MYILTAVNMNTIFCNLTPCSLAEILQLFYRICSLHLKGVLKTNTSLCIYQSIWCYIPEIHSLHDQPCENLKSHTVIFMVSRHHTVIFMVFNISCDVVR